MYNKNKSLLDKLETETNLTSFDSVLSLQYQSININQPRKVEKIVDLWRKQREEDTRDRNEKKK
jgi:hypothetical protein